MNTNSPEQVKKTVVLDLKSQNITQKDLANRIGLTRQTVASILSTEDKYFTDKQATLFSLAMGYDRVFLMTGEGALKSYDSSYSKEQHIHYLEKRLEIFTKAEEASRYINTLYLKLPKEKCLPLIKKAKQMHEIISTIYTIDPLVIQNRKAYDPELMEAALKLFEPLYYDIFEMLEKEYSFEIEY